MTDPLHVPAGERETVRVFAVDLPKAGAEALLRDRPANGAPPPLAALLGLQLLDPDHAELFPADDLKGVGLAGYISEGLGVAEAEVAADRDRLDAETGHILILHARAFGGSEATIVPGPAVRFLARYELAQADPPTLTPPGPAGEGPAATPPDARVGPPARLPRALVLVGFLGAALVVLAAAFVIGYGR